MLRLLLPEPAEQYIQAHLKPLLEDGDIGYIVQSCFQTTIAYINQYSTNIDNNVIAEVRVYIRCIMINHHRVIN